MRKFRNSYAFLSNLENLNAYLIDSGVSQQERLVFQVPLFGMHHQWKVYLLLLLYRQNKLPCDTS